MEYQLSESIKRSAKGQEAADILGKCVHCGMCNATCPTYELLGDELDGPRGRIYQIKQLLEGEPASATIQGHLDRCLTCLSCETTCPSGVKYGRLAEIGKQIVEKQVERPWQDRIRRRLLRLILPHRSRFALLLKLAHGLRPLLPAHLKNRLPRIDKLIDWPSQGHTRKVLILEGCVQASLSPNINAATAQLLDRLGIQTLSIKNSTCCGALSYHLQAEDEAKNFMRANIDAWWPQIEAGAEAIVISASGCGTMIKDYASLLADDADYAQRAQIISARAQDISELIAAQDLAPLKSSTRKPTLAFQSPCSLQHGQGLNGQVEAILTQLGYSLQAVENPHLCCGSAGSYSILQTEIAEKLRDEKLTALMEDSPERIATANIGCLHHLQAASSIPVQHWVEIVAESLSETGGGQHA